MSINYLEANPSDQQVMKHMAEGTLDDDDTPVTIENAPNGPESSDAPQEPIHIPWEQENAPQGPNSATTANP